MKPLKETVFVLFAPDKKPDSMQISMEKAKEYINRRPKFKREEWQIGEINKEKAYKLF